MSLKHFCCARWCDIQLYQQRVLESNCFLIGLTPLSWVGQVYTFPSTRLLQGLQLLSPDSCSAQKPAAFLGQPFPPHPHALEWFYGSVSPVRYLPVKNFLQYPSGWVTRNFQRVDSQQILLVLHQSNFSDIQLTMAVSCHMVCMSTLWGLFLGYSISAIEEEAVLDICYTYNV